MMPPSPHHRRLPLWLLAAAALPAPLIGQGLTLSPFTAVNGGLDPSPRMVGAAATAWWGAAGFRLGGAVDLESSPVAPVFGHPPAEATSAWSADADMVLSGGRAGLSLFGVSPSVFVGFGAHGRRREDGSTRSVPAWSYGAGAALPIMSRLSLDGEVRYRMPHESDDRLLPPDVGAGWELRTGLSLHLGSLGGPTSARRAPARPLSGPRAANPSPSAPGAPAATATRSARADRVAADVLDTADDHLGVRYTWGGNTPAEGFDCSGYVKYVFARHGIVLPRVSRDQRWAGREVRPLVSALLPGDLMFYAGSDGVVNHVAIYAGDHRIIHSSSSGRGVRIDDLSTRRGRYYATRMVAARRVIQDGGSFMLR